MLFFFWSAVYSEAYPGLPEARKMESFEAVEAPKTITFFYKALHLRYLRGHLKYASVYIPLLYICC